MKNTMENIGMGSKEIGKGLFITEYILSFGETKQPVFHVADIRHSQENRFLLRVAAR